MAEPLSDGSGKTNIQTRLTCLDYALVRPGGLRVIEVWLDGELPVEQQADELLGESISNGFTADKDSIEDRAGIHVQEHIDVDIRGEFTAGSCTAEDLDDGGSSWPDELVAELFCQLWIGHHIGRERGDDGACGGAREGVHDAPNGDEQVVAQVAGISLGRHR